jgi:squalene-associated FAD-dependent desaturase
VRLAVVGGGWAGLAAAVAAVEAGHAVTVHEIARQWGGRARRLDATLADGRPVVLDNGQHILIGAYADTLDLMRRVGVEPRQALLRLPLALRFPDGGGLALPDWPAPLDAAWGIARARGWSLADRLSLLRHAGGWQLRGFRCEAALSVAQLCDGLAPRVMQELVEPLCVSALNVPPAQADAQVFLRVLRDSLLGPRVAGWGASNLLLPRVDLGALLPEAAASWLAARGATLRTGHRVQAIVRDGDRWQVDGEPHDAVLLACPAGEAARLVAGSGAPAAAWVEAARGLDHTAIATVYTQGGPALPAPLLALRGGPAQFVFDRGQLGGPAGVLAWVASAAQDEAAALADDVLAQAAALGWPVQPLRTVVEKRATFACTPGLRRPAAAIAPGLAAGADWVEGPYPATLEGAVRAGRQAVALLTR